LVPLIDGLPVHTFLTRRLQGIQVLRIIAALLVLAHHATLYTAEHMAKNPGLWLPGASGVDIFFVISGFVMVHTTRGLIADPDGWWIFAMRRIKRIVPMYWLATTLKVLAMVFLGSMMTSSRLNLWGIVDSYFFIPFRNYNGMFPLVVVGWTLNFEIFFYALFATALLLRADIYKFVGGALAFCAVLAIFRQPSWPAVSFYFDGRGLEFLFGMLLARLNLANWSLRPRFSIPILFIGFAVLLYPREGHWSLLYTGVPATLIVASGAFLEPHLQRIPKWVLYLADASFVIYLFHPMIAPIAPILVARLHIQSPVLSFVGSMAIGLLGPLLVYRLADEPMQRLLNERKAKAVRQTACVS
jgi:peptidoglycan/LPS O-acetylase OafA/YrhL